MVFGSEQSTMALNTIEELLADYKAGKMVILMDDEDRENEGDLIMSADLVRAQDVNFMARFGRGLICLTLTQERCQQLNLPLMVRGSSDHQQTAFTMSIEAAEGVTTGISAADRAKTIQTAIASDAKPTDITMPGHIFPLMARRGGVLTRAGHTEAGCDLGRLAGLSPASVIVEIMNEDGTMARRPELEVFAAEHGIKIGTIAELIRYRSQHEKNVERVTECALPTEFGNFKLMAYQDLVDQKVHFALVMGKPDTSKPTLVRVHMQDSICDLFASTREECGWTLRAAMQQVAQAGEGVIVVLRKDADARSLLERVQSMQLKDRNLPVAVEPMDDDVKTYGVGAQILSDLGLQKLRIIGTPWQMSALTGFGLEVIEFVDKQ
jgi:3,4-dihydroxy 2-butanone 4-phosphate synthase/GTP cyclohydrolase II